jgi:hypothetical protein
VKLEEMQRDIATSRYCHLENSKWQNIPAGAGVATQRSYVTRVVNLIQTPSEYHFTLTSVSGGDRLLQKSLSLFLRVLKSFSTL